MNWFRLDRTERTKQNSHEHLAILSPTEPSDDQAPESGHREALPSACRHRCVLPSVYTHAIPWAIHTKEVAKEHKYDMSYYMNEVTRNESYYDAEALSGDGSTSGRAVGFTQLARPSHP